MNHGKSTFFFKSMKSFDFLLCLTSCVSHYILNRFRILLNLFNLHNPTFLNNFFSSASTFSARSFIILGVFASIFILKLLTFNRPLWSLPFILLLRFRFFLLFHFWFLDLNFRNILQSLQESVNKRRLNSLGFFNKKLFYSDQDLFVKFSIYFS